MKVLQIRLHMNKIFFPKLFARSSYADNKTCNVDELPRHYQPIRFELSNILVTQSIKNAFNSN